MSYVGIFELEEADNYEIAPLAESGCGVTGLINCLLGVNIINMNELYINTNGDQKGLHEEKIQWSNCILRRRNNSGSLSEYLKSRSVAGCSGEDLIESMNILFNDNPTLKLKKNQLSNSEFVPYHQIKNSNAELVDFLKAKLNQKCGIVATLNLQLFGNDAWHHQMIYGVDVDSRNIYCMNPIDVYPENVMVQLLSTPSVLLIKREDVLSRLDILENGEVDFSFINSFDASWDIFDLESQISNMVESPSVRYLSIPAIYVGGLAIFYFNENVFI
eukprot:gene8754-11828_t